MGKVESSAWVPNFNLSLQECGEDKLMRQEDLKVALADAVDRVYDKVCGTVDTFHDNFPSNYCVQY